MASFSSVTRLTGCARKAILSTVCRNFIPKSDALSFGTCFHTALEHGLDKGIEGLREAKLFDDIPMMTEMYARQMKMMIDKKINVLAHEIEFNIPIEGSDEVFRGFIDGIAEMNGDEYLLEFKTAKSIDVSHVAIDSQVTAYLWACRELGLCDPKGVIYIVNKKAMEKEPVILKSGKLSTAKSQGCDYDSYMKKAKEIYGDNIPYAVEECANWIQSNPNPYLVAVVTTRTEFQLNRFGEMIQEYVRMEDAMKKSIKEKGATQTLREANCFPTKMCFQYCDFKDICKTLLMNESADIDDLDIDSYNAMVGIGGEDDKVEQNDNQ